MKTPLNKLDSYFLAYNKINEETAYTVMDMEAKSLITDRRIDLVVKYYYISCREKNQNLDFAKELYEKHIEAFTDGTYREQGNPNKDSMDQYFKVFNELIDAVKVKGVDPDISMIPIGKHDEILDGSHRVACAAYFNQRIRVVRFPTLSVDYGIKFFKKRLLDQKYLDFIAKEFAIIQDDIYLLFAWPRIAKGPNLNVINDILGKNNCRVIYRKKLKFNREQLRKLIYQIYKEEHWIGHNGNDFKGVRRKTDQCYDKNNTVILYLIESPSVEVLTKSKEEIRSFYGMGKSALHTTDTKKETLELLDFTLDRDYHSLLEHSFEANRRLNHSLIKAMGRKLKYRYRVTLNRLKAILRMPV